jgi:hypothetical protein
LHQARGASIAFWLIAFTANTNREITDLSLYKFVADHSRNAIVAGKDRKRQANTSEPEENHHESCQPSL